MRRLKNLFIRETRYAFESKVRPWVWVIGITVTVFTAAIGLAAILGYNICQEQLATTGLNGEWHFWTGCYVELDGDTIPYDRWMNITGTLDQ